ncbi:MAG: radical SAM protein [Deltaproteobacteria bacterium]|nr:radical SAM protein [Deltaproteobacteria bacterium]
MRRLLHPLYRRLETSVHPLRYLFIEITQRCNLRCRHCGSDCTADTRYDELTTAEWLGFFEYLRQNFDRRKLLLCVTGGEPFCAPDFEQILRGLGRCDLAWGLVTNGYALTEKNLQRAVDHGVQTITVSLDGLRESHDWLRDRDGSFERALAGIERTARARLPFFDVVTCVHPRVLGELDALERLLSERGVLAWRLFSIFPKGRARENRELLLDDAQLAELLRWIGQRRRALPPDTLRPEFSCEGYLPPAVDAAVRGEPYFCRAGISIASVLCDGAISACPNISRTLVQGNIRRDDFKTVWEKGFARFRDRSWMQRGPCVGCADWKRCQGNSMHLWDDEANQTARCFLRALT